MAREQKPNDAVVTLNGHRIERQTIEANAEKGWVLVMDCFRRYPTQNPHTIAVRNNLIIRRLYGDVEIRLRGISVPYASAEGHRHANA